MKTISRISALACLALVSCASSILRPCEEGGEPARDKPAAERPMKKQCEQRKSKGGKFLNHGVYREWYSSGKVALEGEFKDGKRHGKWFEYDAEGRVISERWFDQGVETPNRAKQAIGANPGAIERRSSGASGN